MILLVVDVLLSFVNLALIGPFSNDFARDLSQPRRWQSLYDQPEVHFWGPLLNDYQDPWPLNWNP